MIKLLKICACSGAFINTDTVMLENNLRDVEKMLVLWRGVDSNVGVARNRISWVCVIAGGVLNRILCNDVAIVCRPHRVTLAIILLRARKLVFILVER